MSIVIINQFSPNRINYPKALKDVDSNFIFVTKQKHVNGFKSIFKDISGFDNWDSNDSIYKFLMERGSREKIDYVVATHEHDLVKAGKLRDYLEINGQSEESALAFRDKYEMKKKLEGQVNTPEFRKIKDVFDLFNFIKEFGYPFVLKPTDGSGSVGVKIVKDSKDLDRILENGINENLMVETFIEGEMYHVDGLYEDGNLLLSVPSLYINGCLAFHEENYLASVMLEKGELHDRLNNTVRNVLEILPTPSHSIAFHAEFFLTPENELVFCEIASRVGGGMISETLEIVKGVDILSESIKSQCNLPTNFSVIDGGLGGWICIPPKRGTLLNINTDIPFDWVKECYIKESNIGKKFEGASSSADSIVSLVITGDSSREIIKRFEIVSNWFEENCKWNLD